MGFRRKAKHMPPNLKTPISRLTTTLSRLQNQFSSLRVKTQLLPLLISGLNA